ncbi:MAG: type II secretion system F family protein [Sporichthyaceae bacterium]|nr:type II secretion system F family protein [Sporichthyaceae bacterium]
MSDGILLAAGLATIFVAAAVVLGTLGAINAERAQVRRSLAAIDAYRSPQGGGGIPNELDRPFSERVIRPGLRRLIRFGRMMTPGWQIERIRHGLDEAGGPSGWDVDRVLAYKVITLAIGALVGAGIALVLGGAPVQIVTAAVLTAGLGYFVPNLVVSHLADARAERLRRDLPDSLDLLTITVEAGLAFDAALSQVARNTTGPLAGEFFRVLQEMQLGLGRAEALKGLGERTHVPELRQFVTAMMQADSFGIPIAQVLRVQAKEMRTRRSQLAEERAQKVPIKILFPLIFCVMPALFIVVIGPAAIDLADAFVNR